jgi:hypothetical protein
LHPLLVWMIGDPDNLSPATLETDEEEHVIGHQASPSDDLHRKEIGAGRHHKGSPNEFCRRRRPPALQRRRYAMTVENVADRLIGDMISQVRTRPQSDRSPWIDFPWPSAQSIPRLSCRSAVDPRDVVLVIHRICERRVFGTIPGWSPVGCRSPPRSGPCDPVDGSARSASESRKRP